MSAFVLHFTGSGARVKFLSCPWHRPFIVEERDGEAVRYTSAWQLIRRLRGRSFSIELDPDWPRPTLDELRTKIAENPDDAMARMELGAHLATHCSSEEALKEYLKAIDLLSVVDSKADRVRQLADRAFAERMAAKVLENLGRPEEARLLWQSCVDDILASLPDKRYLKENGLYQEAVAKLAAKPVEST